jgi:hypothetical protein
MSLINDFKDEMAQSVTIALASSHGLYGPAHGAGTVYAAHVKLKIKNIKDKNGNDAVSSCQIYLDKYPSVEYDSKITYAGETPPIKLIQRQPDEKGNPYSTIVYT